MVSQLVNWDNLSYCGPYSWQWLGSDRELRRRLLATLVRHWLYRSERADSALHRTEVAESSQVAKAVAIDDAVAVHFRRILVPSALHAHTVLRLGRPLYNLRFPRNQVLGLGHAKVA